MDENYSQRFLRIDPELGHNDYGVTSIYSCQKLILFDLTRWRVDVPRKRRPSSCWRFATRSR